MRLRKWMYVITVIFGEMSQQMTDCFSYSTFSVPHQQPICSLLEKITIKDKDLMGLTANK